MADSEYLKSAVGGVLAKAISSTCLAKPDDPIEYLAQFLLKSVADDAAGKTLAAEKEAAQKAEDKATQAAELEAFKANEKAEALAALHEKEDKRLSSLLETSDSAVTVYNAVLSYTRARTGANCYVMLTDLPEKLMPPKPVAPPPAAEPAEGEEAAEPEPPPEPPAEEGEPEEPPPKFQPQTLEYVCATSTDEALLLGKTLSRLVMPEEGSDEPPPPTGVGEGVTFTAIDEYLSGVSKVYHEAKAIENRSVKFWHLPRIGAYAVAPFEDFEGNVKGVLGFDTLGLQRSFSAEELALLEGLASSTTATLLRIEEGLADAFHTQNAALTAKLPAPPAEGEEPPAEPAEGADPTDAATAALALPTDILKELDGSYFKYLETRRVCAPAVLCVLKGVLALLAPDFAAEVVTLSWDDLKGAFSDLTVPWGDDLFAQIGAFEVDLKAAGWAPAEAMLAALAASPEEGEPLLPSLQAASVLGKVLYDWLAATVAVYKLKAAAEAAAGAEACDSAKAKVRTLFAEIDADGSGSVDKNELAAKLKADAELEGFLGVADAKGCGDVAALVRGLTEAKEYAEEEGKMTLDDFEALFKAPEE